ncbi:MAG: menaquinone via futalosine step 1 [Campylobacter sp.]|nr:menaquinone via futalosine step 1 [Campylobacter sp.]
MIFGKIDYLNLLPFHTFLKQSSLPTYVKKSIEFKKGVPSYLCKQLFNSKVDAAVISSVESRRKKYKKLNMGIVAKNRVISVLVRKNSSKKLDPASMTSNMLSKVLGLNGEVIIGDRALKAYLEDGKESFWDLGEEWNKKTKLPFVFGRFCYRQNGEIYDKIVSNFLKANVKIPNYILKSYAISRGVKISDIRWYLKFISYKMGKKENKALKIFLNKSRRLNFNPN